MNPPAVQETQVLSLGQEDPLEKRMATQFSIFARKIPWTEEPGRLQSMGLQRVKQDQALAVSLTVSIALAWRNGSNSKKRKGKQRQRVKRINTAVCFILLSVYHQVGA